MNHHELTSRFIRLLASSVVQLGLVACALLVSSCSQSHEAKSRTEQEERFATAFGFKPPASIVEIKYSDLYNRNLLDSVYGQWMCFTYDEHVFTRILKEKGYERATGSVFYGDLMDKFQSWWPNVDQEKISLYIREKIYSPTEEGPSFSEYLWYDKASNRIYFHKRWGD